MMDIDQAFHSGREWRADDVYCRQAPLAAFERVIAGDAR